jgi:DNA-binding beta-propeller fold protein YncE
VRRLAPVVASFALLVAFAPRVAAASGSSTVATAASTIRLVKTYQWSPPSPDPTGLTYRASTGRLIVSDAEVDEMRALWKHANVFEAALGGTLRHTGKVSRRSNEPEDVAWDERGGSLYVADDDKDLVSRFDPGRDGWLGTSDDRSSVVLDARAFGSRDPEGLGYRASDRSIFLTDERGSLIFHVSRGGDGRLGTRDDRVSHYRARRINMRHPEDIEFDPVSGHVFIVSSTHETIAEVTVGGTLVRTIDVSFAGLVNPSGIAFAPGSNDPSERHLYVADRGEDNIAHPRENDGRIFEFAIA